jgi:hypothetical protein
MGDPDAAMKWAQARPEGLEKQALIERALMGLGNRFPEEAASLLAQSPPAARSHVIGDIAGAWSGSDPERAVAWAAQLLSADEQAVAWEKLTENWSATHPVEAATWLKTLPPGTGRDAAAAAYARTVMGSDPDAAIAWAASIADPGKRVNALHTEYLHWRQFDPESARRWLEATAEVAPDTKLSLQNAP